MLLDRYLDLVQEILINSIYQDKAMDPWNVPGYTESVRDTGRDWPSQALTMIGRTRLRSLRMMCEWTINGSIEGDFVETGIWRGGACIMMAAVLAAHGVSNRKVWGFDSFEGLPKPSGDYAADNNDPHHTFKELIVSQADVENSIKRFQLSEYIQLTKGWFKDTLPSAAIDKIAVLRLDGDMYESTIQALENLYPKLSDSGFCVIDDYGAVLGCRKAVDDYRNQHNISAPLINIDGLGVYWVK